jgi:hypothetical protein
VSLMEEHVAHKKAWRALSGTLVAHDPRDAIMHFVNECPDKTEIALAQSFGWLGIAKSKFYNRYACNGKVNEHTGKIPRGF